VKVEQDEKSVMFSQQHVMLISTAAPHVWIA